MLVPICRRLLGRWKWHFGFQGFTFLEIMVALFIISMALIAVYRLYSQTLSMNQVLRFNTHASLLAQKKLAELTLMSDEDLVDGSGDFEDPFAGYTWEVSVAQVESELLGDVSEDFKRIDINVSFNQDEMTYRLRTYRFMRR
jgi:general secretion pathway protein I